MSAIPNIHALEWTITQEYCEAQIAELHIDNEGDLDEVETAHIRGQLAMARKVLALALDDAPLELTGSNTYIE
jgi:hypothetical protein